MPEGCTANGQNVVEQVVVVSVDAVEIEKVARILAALTANWGYVLLPVVRVVAVAE